MTEVLSVAIWLIVCLIIQCENNNAKLYYKLYIL